MRAKKTVPFCDLTRCERSLTRELGIAFERVLSSGWYILGKQVSAFESEFAAYCGSKYGVGVASGTEALQVALLAGGAGPGDEVITVANAGVPMVVAITSAGAKPVFVDVHPKSYLMDVAKIETKITRRTRAILPVHLYGQCVNMTPVRALAQRYRLKVIEDACQAHGATYRGKRAGSLGDIGCFSFYPTKNLGGYGDGGMIVTDDAALAAKARMLRDYGQTERYHHRFKGINSRLDELQASLLRVKLKYLDRWNKRRAEIAGMYDRAIDNSLVAKPEAMGYGAHVYHLYVVASTKRDRLQRHLAAHDVQTLVHYPIPVYRQDAYEEFRPGAACKVTDRCAKQVLSLPLYPDMGDNEVYRVCDAVNAFLG